MTEQWRPVIGYEGWYEVSDRGRVRSLDRVVTHRNGRQSRWKGKILKPMRDTGGHHRVALQRNGRAVFGIHQLVMRAFGGPQPKGTQVLHWDDDRENNMLTNLRYGTPRDNCLDCVRNGNHRQASQTHCIHGHAFTPDNTYSSRGKRKCKRCTIDGTTNRRRRLREEQPA